MWFYIFYKHTTAFGVDWSIIKSCFHRSNGQRILNGLIQFRWLQSSLEFFLLTPKGSNVYSITLARKSRPRRCWRVFYPHIRPSSGSANEIWCCFYKHTTAFGVDWSIITWCFYSTNRVGKRGFMFSINIRPPLGSIELLLKVVSIGQMDTGYLMV